MSRAEELWNDHTFRVLLEDLVKARKNDDLAKLRLNTLLEYIAPSALTPAVRPMPSRQAQFVPGLSVVDPPAGAVSSAEVLPPEPEDTTLPATFKDYVNARIAERGDPNAKLRETARLVAEQLSKGRWAGDGTLTVRLPRTAHPIGIEGILRKEFPQAKFGSLDPLSMAPQHAVLGAGMTEESVEGEGSQGTWNLVFRR